MAMRGTVPGTLSTTGVKYLNIDVGYTFIVRVIIKRKHFVVWKGFDKEVGTKIAKKVQSIMAKGEANFLEWYDYEMEGWLKYNGYQNENK